MKIDNETWYKNRLKVLKRTLNAELDRVQDIRYREVSDAGHFGTDYETEVCSAEGHIQQAIEDIEKLIPLCEEYFKK